MIQDYFGFTSRNPCKNIRNPLIFCKKWMLTFIFCVSKDNKFLCKQACKDNLLFTCTIKKCSPITLSCTKFYFKQNKCVNFIQSSPANIRLLLLLMFHKMIMIVEYSTYKIWASNPINNVEKPLRQVTACPEGKNKFGLIFA